MVQGLESGTVSSVEGYTRIGLALGLEPRFTLLSERAAAAARAADPVHAAMGDAEARHLLDVRSEVHLDEPYQHYQFAGRADLVAVSHDRTALLHIENRTRFPDVGQFAGSYNAKRAYLTEALGRKLLGSRPPASETHVVVALWSSEVLHALRLRRASFAAIAPDPPDAFAGWWAGTPPATGRASIVIVFDPLPCERRARRQWVGLDEVGRIEPRYRGYAQALAALRSAGRA